MGEKGQENCVIHR